MNIELVFSCLIGRAFEYQKKGGTGIFHFDKSPSYSKIKNQVGINTNLRFRKKEIES